MKWGVLALAIAASATMHPASAAEVYNRAAIEARYTPDYEKCMRQDEAAQGITVAMGDCLSAEYARQDARLNLAYHALLKKLDPWHQAALRKAQRAWLTYKDAKCDSERSEGGTIVRLQVLSCGIDAVIVRTGELEDFPTEH